MFLWIAKLAVDWSMDRNVSDLKPALLRYSRYFESLGLKKNTVVLYTRLANIYLQKAKIHQPTPEDAQGFYDNLSANGMSRSSINNFAAALIKYHAMVNLPVKLKFLRPNNSLPYYFDEKDILKIFSKCINLKHHCMLKVLFFGCLRSGELCNLDLSDYPLMI
jgi:integrase/recombinase XerD